MNSLLARIHFCSTIVWSLEYLWEANQEEANANIGITVKTAAKSQGVAVVHIL